MNEPMSFEIIPAHPNIFTVYQFDDEDYSIEDQVIAWRIETNYSQFANGLCSNCIPITADGDVGSNCIGIQNPDKSISLFEDGQYANLSELQSCYREGKLKE